MDTPRVNWPASSACARTPFHLCFQECEFRFDESRQDLYHALLRLCRDNHAPQVMSLALFSSNSSDAARSAWFFAEHHEERGDVTRIED